MAKIPLAPPKKIFTFYARFSCSQRALWLAVNTQRTQARSVTEFIEQVRREKGKHHYSSSAPASTGHLMSYHFNEQNRIGMEHVGYKGAGPATLALLSGEVSACFIDLSSMKPHLTSGKIRLLGVSGPGRSQQTPDVPSLKARDQWGPLVCKTSVKAQ